jgi:hypothetical protein
MTASVTPNINNPSEVLIVWEAPKIEPPEFRLYYDELGKVVCYSCEKLKGAFIVIDALTFACARPDIRVIDGRISTVPANAVVFKLMPNKTEGKSCVAEDISIIPDAGYLGNQLKWNHVRYEL